MWTAIVFFLALFTTIFYVIAQINSALSKPKMKSPWERRAERALYWIMLIVVCLLWTAFYLMNQ